ncbi:MAG: hypothetical protein JO301_14220 [Chitinophagaceae bacterium]|nr:hypothetical protein [Chitinophagaceae bacterium]
MSRLIEFIGPFHPVLVHLPIGFILLAILFQWLSLRERYAGLAAAVRLTYLLGAISAVLSCLTGLALSSGGDYDPSTLQWHKWFGIGVAVISLVGYWYASKPFSLQPRLISIAVLVLLVITGHLGGTLTHGEGFLTKALAVKTDSGQGTKKTIANTQEAVVYSDIIQPILTEKCGGCHGAIKQKGGLRLDAKDWILKGGKNGQVFHSGDASGSELYRRLVLDPLEEKHMPPKGKPQPTEQELNLIQWWINSGAGFDKKAKDVQQTAVIAAALQSLQHQQQAVQSLIPAEKVDAADPALLDRLRKAGIAITPVAINSNYLQASFVSIPKPDDSLIALLADVRKQLIWLRLPAATLTNEGWKKLTANTSLIRLNIEHSNITDALLPMLNQLTRLQYLNLVGTKITSTGVQQLKMLTGLKEIYLGQTMVSQQDLVALKQAFPKTAIDIGGYQVSSLATDTQTLHPPPKK